MESSKGSGASSSTCTTSPPSGMSRSRARSRFGSHDSVARSTGGAGGIPATTSPPPVCTASIAEARAGRSPTRRAYPHGGRSSLARPWNQLKSHPGWARPHLLRSVPRTCSSLHNGGYEGVGDGHAVRRRDLVLARSGTVLLRHRARTVQRRHQGHSLRGELRVGRDPGPRTDRGDRLANISVPQGRSLRPPGEGCRAPGRTDRRRRYGLGADGTRPRLTPTTIPTSLTGAAIPLPVRPHPR